MVRFTYTKLCVAIYLKYINSELLGMQTTLRNEELKGLKTLCTQECHCMQWNIWARNLRELLKILKDKLKDKVEVNTDSDYFRVKMRRKRDLPYRCDLSVSDWLTTTTCVGNMQSRITAKKAGVINKAARKVPTQCNDIVTTGPISVLHPDLEIRGGGHPDPEICRGAVSKTFFSALWASVWSDRKGVLGPWAPPLDPPLNLTDWRD